MESKLEYVVCIGEALYMFVPITADRLHEGYIHRVVGWNELYTVTAAPHCIGNDSIIPNMEYKFFA